jgi:hypothetical protein
MAASGLSTAIIHYCVSPYVSEVKIPKKDIGSPNPLLHIHTLSFFGNDFVTKVRANHLKRASSRMFANCMLHQCQTRLNGSEQVHDDEAVQHVKWFRGLARPRTHFFLHDGLMFLGTNNEDASHPEFVDIWAKIQGHNAMNQKVVTLEQETQDWNAMVQKLKRKQ